MWLNEDSVGKSEALLMSPEGSFLSLTLEAKKKEDERTKKLNEEREEVKNVPKRTGTYMYIWGKNFIKADVSFLILKLRKYL